MRVKDGRPATTAERRETPKVAPRFTRAAQAERSRLQGRREQLLRKREAAQAEVAQIDLAVSEVDELLELLAPPARRQRQRTRAERRRHGAGRRAGRQPAKE
jgi:hypothetical protein